MYIETWIISLLIGIIIGAVCAAIICSIVYGPVDILPKPPKKKKKFKSPTKDNPLIYESSELEIGTRKKSKNDSIDINFVIRSAIEDYIQLEGFSRIPGIEHCRSIKQAIELLSEVIYGRFGGYITSNFYQYDLSEFYTLSDDEIKDMIYKKTSDYISLRKKIQAQILEVINNNDTRPQPVSTQKEDAKLDTVDIFKSAGFLFDDNNPF